MEQKSNKQKAREIVGFVLNPKCANGSYGLGLLNTHNQRNADLNNINKCCEEVAMQAMQWKDEQAAQEKQQLIDEACEWLFKNDSYAIPTNVQVDRLREHLNNIK